MYPLPAPAASPAAHVCPASPITLSEPALVAVLCGMSRRGAFPVTLDVRVDARARKTGNPFGTVYKRSRVNGFLNWHYGTAVNRQRDREGLAADFEPAPRQWGVRLEGTPLVLHKGAAFLELKVESSTGPSYEAADGTPLDLADVLPFLPASRDGADRQGVERPVVLRDYAVASVMAVTAGGADYLLARPAAVPALLPAA